MDTANADWGQQVLDFWFKELNEKDWFVASKKLDKTITDRFQSAHSQVKTWSSLPLDANHHRALAAIIVLDQFSRNMYRGTKKAYDFDALALRFAKQALARELEQSLDNDGKQFLYMPFMHSENLDDQKTAVKLFTKLGRPEHAVEHLSIFKKFNRFPHRNKTLNRESTDQEIAYLEDAKTFGQ